MTIMFTEECRVVIKFLHQNKGYSARCLAKEFLLKNWQFDKLLKKIDAVDSDIKHWMLTSQVTKLITG